MNEWRIWFDSRLDDAIEAAENQENSDIESKSFKISHQPGTHKTPECQMKSLH